MNRGWGSGVSGRRTPVVARGARGPFVRQLVVGVPRSGTTWVAQSLAMVPELRWVNEPDNRDSDAFAHIGVTRLGRHPVLSPGDRDPSYEALWDLAFSGGWPARGLASRLWAAGRGLPEKQRIAAVEGAARAVARYRPRQGGVLVKTVLGIFALEWLADRYTPVVIAVRSAPINIVSSWVRLGWVGGHLTPEWIQRHRPEIAAAAVPLVRSDAGRVALAVAVLAAELDAVLARHPGWVVVHHEDLCRAPVDGFRCLYERLGLRWSSEVAAAIAERDRPGHGMETARLAADQVHRWRRLTTGDLDEVTGVLEAAGVDASPPTDDPAGVRVSSPLRPPVAPREPSSAGSPR